ncbi:MAG: cytochrome c3 family protein [Spirochaetes bacterium]|nr:cytochrome c3 family protein [Spirochaetota bacterium]
MRNNFFSAAAIAIFIAIIATACSLDPWVAGKEYPDVVAITKTTRFGKVSNGISPMKSAAGVVHFSHKTHEGLGIQCIECHHKKDNPERIKQCATCHIGDNGYNTMHGLCLDCHIAKKDGPQNCQGCH